MADVVMSELYYDLLRQVEQMTLVDQALGGADRAPAALAPFAAQRRQQGRAPALRGEVLYARHGFIHGWAFDERAPGTPVVVRSLVAGRAIASTTAGEPVPALLPASAARFISPRCGFTLRAFPANKRIRRTRIDVEAGEEGLVLAAGLDIHPPSAALRHTSFEGYAEPASDGRARGWVWCKDRPGARIEVVILVNGAAVARVPADRYREDLAGAGIGDGEHGFDVALPRRLIDAGEKSIEIAVAENGVRLLHSPMILRGRQIVARPPSRWRSMRASVERFARSRRG